MNISSDKKIEAHAHIFMNGTDYRAAVSAMRSGPEMIEKVVRENLKTYADHGITWVRDGGDHYGATVLAKALAPEYGISYRTPVYAIHKKGHYGAIVGRAFSDIKEYRDLVEQAVHASECGDAASQENVGADFIKIMISGIMDFDNAGGLTEPSLDADEIREMIDIAHSYGKAVMAHTNGVDAVMAAVNAGVDSIEHGNFMNEECVHALSESDTIYVPTLSTLRNLGGDDRFPAEAMSSLWERQKEVIRLCFDMGVKMAVGSDAGSYRVLHGKGAEDEAQAFEEALADVSEQDIRARLESGAGLLMSKF